MPVLGICYGMQIGCKILGADVKPAKSREYGRTAISIGSTANLFAGLSEHTTVWMSHGDQVNQLTGDFEPLAATATCPIAAVRHTSGKFYGVQFHPEVTHTPRGAEILKNFLYDICGCAGDWQMSDFVEETVAKVRQQVGKATVSF